MTALTPHQIIADIKALDRQINDWTIEGRLDWDVDQYLKAKRAELLEELREEFTIERSERFGDWFARRGNTHYAYGPTELEAVERLLTMIGEDA